MKIKLIMKLAAGLSLVALATKAEIISDDLVMWERFCDNEIEGGVTMSTFTERQMRDVCATNVFKAMVTNNYDLISYSTPIIYNTPDLHIQGVDYKFNENDDIFEVWYVTSTNKNTGGLMGILELRVFYTTRGGKIFKQYQDGLGDVCLIDTNVDVANPTTIRDVFFSRDNVAVRVRSRNASNILEFARLLDACILSSPVETPPVTQ